MRKIANGERTQFAVESQGKVYLMRATELDGVCIVPTEEFVLFPGHTCLLLYRPRTQRSADTLGKRVAHKTAAFCMRHA